MYKSKRNKSEVQKKLTEAGRKSEWNEMRRISTLIRGKVDGIEAQQRNGVNLRSLGNEWRKKNNVIKTE